MLCGLLGALACFNQLHENNVFSLCNAVCIISAANTVLQQIRCFSILLNQLHENNASSLCNAVCIILAADMVL